MNILKNITDFFAWWLQGLAYLLPEGVKQVLNPSPDILYIRSGRDVISFDHYHGSSQTLIESRTLPRDNSSERLIILEWIKELQKKDVLCALLLNDEDLLTKSLSMPANALNNIRDILGFEMDKHTPFSSEQVYFDYIIDEKSSSGENLQLDLYVVTRKIADDLSSEMERLDIPFSRISSKHQGHLFSCINFDTENKSASAGKLNELVNVWLLLLCVLLFLAALFFPLSIQKGKLLALEEIINDQRKVALEVAALEKTKFTALSQNQFLLTKKKNSLPAIELIAEMTKVLPDDTWLNRLIIRDKEIQITGESASATSIIKYIEDSVYFDNANFRSPISRNSRSNKDRFNINARVNTEADNDA